ncbi:MAG: uracil-DNA glycosylase [Microgenomates group bacterium]|jgi:uracil-DNA glycosylase|nr:uracil-DNA glycosylase [Candidatus Woesebacteria bacterium]MBP6883022.1 uracil-DNA glycosylase [Candidatus Woesebacteria bacterium]QQR63783.1 MAG: uracil-DNA glycosylase [Candidatus Roizmanbacteria bacterium]
MQDIRIETTWKDKLSQEFTKSYWKTLSSTVREQYLSKIVYPPAKQVFRAFDLCPFEKTKVVIVGQDPYHGPNQANGLCFAVNDGVGLPPSLKNIYKEIKSDLGVSSLESGDLTRWASQGVLMLNSVLTVLANTPASHKDMGWEQFTDAVIHSLNAKKKHVVYMLWGKYAQAKGSVIDRENNLVLTSGHPSPFSATLFFNNHHFSKCNSYLEKHGLSPIDWR